MFIEVYIVILHRCVDTFRHLSQGYVEPFLQRHADAYRILVQGQAQTHISTEILPEMNRYEMILSS